VSSLLSCKVDLVKNALCPFLLPGSYPAFFLFAAVRRLGYLPFFFNAGTKLRCKIDFAKSILQNA
jgi:hypothetical protein